MAGSSHFAEADFDEGQPVALVDRVIVELERQLGGSSGMTLDHIAGALDDAELDLDELLAGIDDQLTSRNAELTRVQRTFDRELGSLQDSCRNVVDLFTELDERIKRTGDKAIQIGARLRSVDVQRTRADEARRLIDMFIQFNDASSADALDPVFVDPDRLPEALMIVKQLTTVASDLDVAGYDVARAAIEKQEATLKNRIVENIRAAYVENNVPVMQQGVATLCDLGVERELISVFVKLFFETLGSDQLSLARLVVLKAVDSLATLSGEVLLLLSEQHALYAELFDDGRRATRVMLLYQLVRAIFEDRIFLLLEELLSEHTRTQRSYLRNLRVVFVETFKLVRVIESEHDIAAEGEMHLRDIVEAFFTPFKSSYFEKELRLVRDVCEKFLHQAHRRLGLIRERRGLLRRYVVVGPDDPPAAGAAASTDDVSETNLEDDGGPATYGVLSAEALGEQVSVELAQIFLRIYEESLERACALSMDFDLMDNVQHLFMSLLGTLGKEYLFRALRVVVDAMPVSNDGKAEPALESYLTVVSSTNTVIRLLHEHFAKLVGPVIRDSVNVRTICLQALNGTLSQTEQLINEGMERSVSLVSEYIRRLLAAKQVSADYLPKRVVGAPETAVTNACQSVLNYIERLHALIEAKMEARNGRGLLVELLERLIGTLLLHIKTQRFNEHGAIRLLADLQAYQNAFHVYGFATVDEHMKLLREIGTLYLVEPQNLRALCDEGQLAELDRRVVLTLLSLRSDWKQIRHQVNFVV